MSICSEDRQSLINQHDMIWERPASRWLDAIPLANGHIGTLIWGDGHPLKVSLDKYDCWELREVPTDAEKYNYQTLRWLVEQEADQDINRIFWPKPEDPAQPYPTRLPMPRLAIDFGSDCTEFTARLALHSATASGQISLPAGSVSWSVYAHATYKIIVIELNDLPDEFSPSVAVGLDHLNDEAKRTLKNWGYEPAETGVAEGINWLRQRFPAGGEYVVAWMEQRHGSSLRVLLTIVTHNDDHNPLPAATNLLEEAISEDPDELHAEHCAWWQEFWQASMLHIPDTRLEALYYAEMYKLGSSARPEGLPISLQGLWTIDSQMPPWSGDYHLDMNVQEAYWPVYTSNHLELGHSLYQTLYDDLPLFKHQCQRLFDFEGAWSGCSIAYDGTLVPCWATPQFWPGNGAWLRHMYWLHWLYSQDEEFLRTRAYPMMSAFMLTYLNLLEEGVDGKLHLPLSSSPEWEGPNRAAWGADTTCDLGLIKWLTQALIETIERLDIDDPDAPRWREVQQRLVDYLQDDRRGLLIKEDTSLSRSHRHHSHLMPIHPLGVLTIDDGPGARDLITRSIGHWRGQGAGQWTGWSFPWASLIASRCGLGNMAWQMLDLYANAFITCNTFHINGDPRWFGVSYADYEPMTVEGGFCAAAAIMEMLLQSWGGKIRLFPTVPDRWHDGYFTDLRAEGAFLVTSRLREEQVLFAEVFSERGGPCRVVSPWPEQKVILVSLADATETMLDGAELEFSTTAGQRYRLYPQDQPPTDEDLAPVLPTYDAQNKHFFGVKRLARF